MISSENVTLETKPLPNSKPKGTFRSIRFLLSKRPEILLLVFLILVVFARWFSLGAFGSGDGEYITFPELELFHYFPVWDARSGLGTNNAFSLGYYFQYTLDWLIALVTKNVNVGYRLAWYWPCLIIAAPSMYCFAEKLFRSRLVSFGATILFIINTEFFYRSAGGVIPLNYPYVLAPLILLLVIKSIESRKLFWSLLASLPMAFSLTTELRTFFLFSLALGIFLFWYFINDTNSLISRLRFYIAVGICLSIPTILIYSYAIIPSFLFGGLNLPSGYSNHSWLYALSFYKVSNALTLYESHYPVNITFATFPIPYIFFLIPLLGFIPLASRRKDKNIAFLATITLLGVFLTKGTNAPLGDLNVWIFDNIPGFYGFRDPDKFYVLPSFGLALLVPVGFETTLNFITRNIAKINFSAAAFAKVAIQASVLVIFIFAFKPAFFQEIGGTFNSFNLPQWQLDIEKSFEADTNFYRALWVPDSNSIVPHSEIHPEVRLLSLIDYYGQTRPITDFRNEYASNVSSSNQWSFLNTPTVHQFFNLLGLRYVYMPQGYANPLTDLPPDASTIKSRLDISKVLPKINWLKAANTTKIIPAYVNPDAKGLFFPVSQHLYFTGPDDIYNTLASIPNFDLTKIAVTPNDQDLAIVPSTNQIQFFNQTNFNDFALHFVPEKYFINLYNSLPRYNDPKSAWGREQMVTADTWNSIGQSGVKNSDFDYGKGFVYASRTGSFTAKVSVPESGSYHVLVRDLNNPQGTNLTLEIANQKISLQLPVSSSSVFHWYDLGSLNIQEGNQSVVVGSSGGFNAINLLAFVPDNVLDSANANANSTLNQSQVVQLEKLNSSDMKRVDLDSAKISGTISAIKSGNYQLQLHFTEPLPSTKVIFTIDNQSRVLNLGSIKHPDWYQLPSISLNKGDHSFKLNFVGIFDEKLPSEALKQASDGILLTYGSNTFQEILSNSSSLPTVTGTYLNPSTYVAHITSATKPVDLVFNFSYDPNWVAEVKNNYYHPEEVYSMLQEYHIDQIGTYDVVFEYRPQKYEYLGLALSGISLVITLLSIYLFRRKKW